MGSGMMDGARRHECILGGREVIKCRGRVPSRDVSKLHVPPASVRCPTSCVKGAQPALSMLGFGSLFGVVVSSRCLVLLDAVVTLGQQTSTQTTSWRRCGLAKGLGFPEKWALLETFLR